MSFHPGQRVVCVDDVKHGAYSPWKAVEMAGEPWVKRGKVYEIREIKPYRGLDCIYLTGLIRWQHADGTEPGFSFQRFRPLDESRLDVFRAHLITPPKQKVKEQVA